MGVPASSGGRACAPSGLSRDASQAEPLVPNAAAWRYLNILADLGCNLSQCSFEESGFRIVEGPAADSAGEVGLQALADHYGIPVSVESGSYYHTGKVIHPALAAATGTAKTPTAAECEASQSGGDSRNAHPSSSPSESK